MREPEAVIVGIDGSRSATEAAVWAVDEAVSRDLPLRLVHALRHGDSMAVAKTVVHEAFTAIESTEEPVKLEAEIVRDSPVHALRSASRGAAMLCVGSTGLSRRGRGRISTVAAALASSAHCPVAVIGGSGARSRQGWVVAELEDVEPSGGGDVTLTRAVEEASLRHAALHVVATWHSRYTDIHGPHAVAGGNRLVRARLDRRLADWRSRHPGLDVQPVAVHGNFINYVVRHADSIQSIVVSHDRADGLAELVGPPGRDVLRETGCVVLVCER
ncbi:universal stress family protein [Mycolicibacterium chubuense NBB4]|uniref:Universal stress family protein n=1 Tax=Mycolicibacterium chubuense (strain NBB4) TaxID=710421 RepID=I4BG87_MYCCN|nr:universal stress protein [Mycolicibacterium chubuense]AFM16294.1 universal stress family protein [Mycolicibacterium chubuense NBB4]